MATFRFELNGRPSKQGRYVVYLRETVDGKRRLIKTPVDIKRPSEFNTKTKRQKWIRGNSPEAKRKNEILVEILEKARSSYVNDLKDDNPLSCLENVEYIQPDYDELLVADPAPAYGSNEDSLSPSDSLNPTERRILELMSSLSSEQVDRLFKIYWSKKDRIL